MNEGETQKQNAKRRNYIKSSFLSFKLRKRLELIELKSFSEFN